MAQEIERKFLVDKAFWESVKNRYILQSDVIVQGYITNEKDKVVRIRTKGQKAFLTLKGKSEGITQPEFEYEVPYKDANEMFDLFVEVTEIIEKERFYFTDEEGHVWEVDEFHGINEGLIVAELELKSEDEKWDKPFFVKEDVTSDKRYKNNNLISFPYSMWKEEVK